MTLFVVGQGQLFLRSSPEQVADNILAVLPEGTEVNVIDNSNARWWKVQGKLIGTAFEGFVGKSRLVAKAAVTPVVETGPAVPAVHYREGDASVLRTNVKRVNPLGEAGMPRRPKSPALATAPLLAFVDWAKVDVPAHKRWKPGGGQTFCNIYAYDYCYAAGVYLPRVWWMPAAIKKLEAGQPVAADYGITIREMNANSLHDWLLDWGDDFGWKRTLSLNELQDQVNQGAVGIICGRRTDTNRPGHITAVVPEHGQFKAHRVGNKVVLPLQSQAGASNVRYGAAGAATVSKQWWTGAQFGSFVYMYNRRPSRWP